ncbi:MAG: ThiF family adenylyltransferase [Vicinamibacterales bacterium]
MASDDDRQSFLGPALDDVLRETVIGVVGLSGGGSHVVQQLAHIGFQQYVLFDPDSIEATNLHRLVGATAADVKSRTLKVDIAKRIITGVRPAAKVLAVPQRWQGNPTALRRCDVVLGCVDSFEGRGELEVTARRFLIPYIDIGMDVVVPASGPPRMFGQVFLSMPGAACMRCARLLSERSAPRYGDAGGRPQVVWANGILASAAVACVVDLVTGWTASTTQTILLSYDGNASTLELDARLEHLRDSTCKHFPLTEVGSPRGMSV